MATRERSQLLLAMRLVREGCEAALAERATFGTIALEFERRDRWVTAGLIDAVHERVASEQGVAPWEAEATRPGWMQPELSRCFEKMELYLDIDLPEPWAPADKARLVGDACVDGDWDGETPYMIRAADADAPREMSTEQLFLRMVECAVKR